MREGKIDNLQSSRISVALDALNFLAADVRNAFGPYINLLLVTERHWTQSEVGIITTASGLLGIAVQTPIGAAIDVTRAKRGVIALAMAVMAVCAIIIYALPAFWSLALATSLLALAGDAFVPAVAALTLGLCARDQLARRLGRNSAFDHGGNIVIAIVAGAVGYFFSQSAVFLLVPFFAALTIVAVMSIPAAAIDHERARDLGHDGETDQAAAGYSVLLQTRPLVIFAISAAMFHFANAPLMPLVAQKLAFAHPKEATAMMSFCVVAAQGVMLPIALLVGHKADRWGRKPLFLVAFAVLPIRAWLYTLSDNAFWLIGVQLLDGVGAGVFQALAPLVIADIMRGTGRYNLAQGAVATCQGIGAALSGLAAGEIVDHFGYAAAFVGLGIAAAGALAVFALGMPETREAAL
jgi:MFS family permease